MLKRVNPVLVLALLLPAAFLAADDGPPAAAPAAVSSVAEDIALHRSCPLCGMDREQWGFSRMLVEYENGGSLGTCSLHCAAVSLAADLDRRPAALLVADHDTRLLIDAETAVWVLGGGKPGVMTRRAKWAFATAAAAEAFARRNGGELTGFEGAIRAAYEDMYEDTRMIRERRAARRRAMQAPPAPVPAP